MVEFIECRVKCMMSMVEELGRNKHKYAIINSYTGYGIILLEGKQKVKD